MDEDGRVKLVENALEVTESMLSAWALAGGVIRLSELKSMTSSHLLEIMARNDIRFCFKDKLSSEFKCLWADGGGLFGKTLNMFEECTKCKLRNECKEAKDHGR
jgi:hypothetical protein